MTKDIVERIIIDTNIIYNHYDSRDSRLRLMSELNTRLLQLVDYKDFLIKAEPNDYFQIRTGLQRLNDYPGNSPKFTLHIWIEFYNSISATTVALASPWEELECKIY